VAYFFGPPCIILVYVIITESFSVSPAWKSSMLPQYHFATQSLQFMFHFLKSSRRSLLLEARFVASNSQKCVWGRALPWPAGGAKALPDPLAGIRGHTCTRGGKRWGGKEGREAVEGNEGEGRRGWCPHMTFFARRPWPLLQVLRHMPMPNSIL